MIRGLPGVLSAARRRSGGGGSPAFITSLSVVGSTRNDYGGYVGFAFTVGSAGLHITQLGRWILGSNTQAHSVYLYQGPMNSGTLLATVLLTSGQVSTFAGATPNAFLYGTVGTPVALLPATLYYVVSLEVATTGDLWLSENTVPVTTSDATIGGACYGLPATNVAYDAMGVFAFVPTNFQYTKP